MYFFLQFSLIKCTKCQSSNKIKTGFAGERQRYNIKIVAIFFSVEKKSDVKTIEQKCLILEMYLEELGFRAIGKLLNINYSKFISWLRNGTNP
ncbi:hypothetical protein D1003_00430 [Riemerella anatipestifer]|nr:hypothetical protein [Riemerella anatipestifer]